MYIRLLKTHTNSLLTYISSHIESCSAVPLLTAAEEAGVITAASVVGIAIGAVAFVALTGVGAKKGYDYLKAGNAKMSNLHSNPLYQETKTGGQNPFYDGKV